MRLVSGQPCTQTTGTPPRPRGRRPGGSRGAAKWVAKRAGSMSDTARRYATRRLALRARPTPCPRLQPARAPDGAGRRPTTIRTQVRRQLLDHLAGHPDAMWRSCPDGHLTGSTLVARRQPHAGPCSRCTPRSGAGSRWAVTASEADADLAATALREAVEESGIDELVLLPGPVDLDVHALAVPEGSAQPPPRRALAGRRTRRTPSPGRARSRPTCGGSRSTPLRPTLTRARFACVRLARAAHHLTPLRGLGTLRRHDARGLPQARPRADRLDRRLPRGDRAPSGRLRRWSPAGCGPAPRPPTERAGALRRGAGRPRPGDRARADPLAAPQLLRLLPGQHQLPGDPRRAGRGRPRRERHAVGHQPGLHRGRDPDAGLDGRAARPARALPVRAATGGGVIQGSASEATLCAILAARRAGHAGAGNRRGRTGDLVAYATSQAHSSIEKGLRIAGIGSDNLRVVAHDAAVRDAPRRAGRGHRRGPGRRAVGRSSSAPRPAPPRPRRSTRSPRIAGICADEGLWLHLDAAMSGIAALCPELRWVNAGLDQVDSYCTNPHKWMGVNFDCDLFWVADRAALLDALSHPARVPAHRGGRGRRGHRLPRLADPPRPAVPVAQAVVHAALRRCRRRSRP